MKRLFFLFLLISGIAKAEDGYRLWLRYDLIDNPRLLAQYRSGITSLQSTASVTATEELLQGLRGLLGKKIPLTRTIQEGTLIVKTDKDLTTSGEEGFLIRSAILSG
ncbi:MAG TPA: alpha-glucuronidase family glycosyl hydrolase, partial [Puia sp.]